MDRPGDRRRRRSLSATAGLMLLALAAPACHHKVIRAGRLDRQAIVAIGEQVSRARGLAFLRPVRFRLLGSADMQAQAREQASFERDDARSRRATALLSMLGLVRAGCDAAGAIEAIVSTQPAGAYQQGRDRLLIVERPRVRSELLEIADALLGRDLSYGEIVAHELTHALQDQHFGLDPPESARDNADARLAHAALVEGDAFLTGYRMGAGALVAEPAAFLDFARHHAPDMGEEVPAYLQERFKFPYLEGGAFVLALERASGWAAVDAAHRSPPRSTEEVLHPERYLAGLQRDLDPPRIPDLDALGEAVPGFEPVLAETLGEWAIGLMVARGQRRASGWGGDRALLFERSRDGARLLAWVVDWDSPAAATAFFDAFADRLQQQHGSPAEVWAHGARWQAARARFAELQGERVVYLDAPAGVELWPLLLEASRAPVRVLGHPDPAPARRLEPIAVERAVQIDPTPPRHSQAGPAVQIGSPGEGATLGGFMQLSGVRGDPDTDAGLEIYRLRLRAAARLARALDLGLRVELELNGSDDLVQDAALRFSPVSPELLYLGHLELGRAKTPFSRSALERDDRLPTFRLPLGAAELGTGRRLGVGYDIDLARYGLPIALRAGAYEGSLATEDGLSEGGGPLLAARLEIRPLEWLELPIELRLAAGYLHDHDFGGLLRDQQTVVIDGRLGWGPAWLEAEGVLADTQPQASFASRAWSLTAGAFVLPDFLELLLRYEQLDTPSDPVCRQLTGGVTFLYLSQFFRVRYNIIWRTQDGQDDRLMHAVEIQAGL
ncbi:MAG: hypothetical protein JXR96_18970 [Deltaproteobacteria bacterium]|nr:hypothetical protein [Deltaproteobacteria bacterium]